LEATAEAQLQVAAAVVVVVQLDLAQAEVARLVEMVVRDFSRQSKQLRELGMQAVVVAELGRQVQLEVVQMVEGMEVQTVLQEEMELTV
jgi:hypothetical protein